MTIDWSSIDRYQSIWTNWHRLVSIYWLVFRLSIFIDYVCRDIRTRESRFCSCFFALDLLFSCQICTCAVGPSNSFEKYSKLNVLNEKCCLPCYILLAASSALRTDPEASEVAAEVRSDAQLDRMLFHQYKRVADWLRFLYATRWLAACGIFWSKKIEIPDSLWMLPYTIAPAAAKTKQQQQQQQQQQQMWSENHSGCAQEFGIRGQTNYLNFIS